jgi:hypothetical protein
MAELFGQHLGGRWGFFSSGRFISGEPVAGWAGFDEDESGRGVLVGLVIIGDAITADLLRKVPVGNLENSFNLDDRDARERLDEELKALPPLKRTPEMAPEDFSQLVADHFKVWAKAVPHPANAMAIAADVKPPTMHTWIREARLRGLLPPAKRRKGRRDGA